MGVPKISKLKNQSPPKYTIWNYILLFFTFSFIGWIWEVSLHLVQSGTFVNRGVLLGPWLPIYGSGGVLFMLLLRKCYNKPVLTFILSMVIASIIEYGTSYYLEVTKGLKWWDYSNNFMNLNGRICLEGAIVFGLGGCAAIYLIAPALVNIFNKIPNLVVHIVCILLVVIIACDFIHSGTHPNVGEGISSNYIYLINKELLN